MTTSRLKTVLLPGLVAGAAGTTAINAATYLDMTIRGRAPSQTPEQTIDAIVARVPVEVPGSGDQRRHRVSGLAGMSGIATGISVGLLFGVLRQLGFRPPALIGGVLVGAAAMAATGTSMKALRVSDPASWSATDWLADALPHAVYGTVTYLTLRLLQGPHG
jgi:hypothetical protein